jgi:hypothetical protein
VFGVKISANIFGPWDRCYYFTNIFAKTFWKKLAFFTQNNGTLWKKLIIEHELVEYVVDRAPVCHLGDQGSNLGQAKFIQW